MTTAIESPVKRFAVAHEPEAKKPYVIRTADHEFRHSRKSGADKTIMALIRAGFTLDTTGATQPAETHRNDPPTLTRVSTFDYLGFACRIGYDRETRDWLMEVDGQPIGYARTEDLACSTIRTHCEEVECHTRATTADMAADAAAAQAEVNEPAPPRAVDELQEELGKVAPARPRTCPNCGGTNIDWSYSPPRCRFCDPTPDDAALGEDPEDTAAPAPGACRACGGAHHIQACGEVRAALLAYDKGAGTGGNPVITIAVPADDPCADVRAKLARARRTLEVIVALASGWDERGALGPREPLSWETVARMAMDCARAALA